MERILRYSGSGGQRDRKAHIAGGAVRAGEVRPTTLPDTLVRRPELHERLTVGAGKRLTVVVGSAGAGKSVLLSSWASADTVPPSASRSAASAPNPGATTLRASMKPAQ
jgi:hypothetical protein